MNTHFLRVPCGFFLFRTAGDLVVSQPQRWVSCWNLKWTGWVPVSLTARPKDASGIRHQVTIYSNPTYLPFKYSSYIDIYGIIHHDMIWLAYRMQVSEILVICMYTRDVHWWVKPWTTGVSQVWFPIDRWRPLPPYHMQALKTKMH